jgi:copper homeostasis protein
MIEIIATTIEDAIAAEKGGADRIELISNFEVGGLTPSLEIVRAVIDAVKIPVRVMLRESEDFQVRDDHERQRLCTLAASLSALPIDGIVCGFIANEAVDEELLKRIIVAAPQTKITFHRAFEELSNPQNAIHQLKQFPAVDCILTSGGKGNQVQKIENYRLCLEAASPEIMILAGGGMTDEMMDILQKQAGIQDFHFGTFVREPKEIDGKVSEERVRKIVQLSVR